ncbi:MAG: hypothetical protein HYU51_11600 [Candidatus Rokubacteria bacterium]|nr:hypothetical protein [Candidatus Rokubacteria bacterium]
MGVPRSQELKKRRNRHHKLAKLRKMYEAARTQDERSRILVKVTRVSPGLLAETFLAPLGRS